MPPLCKPLSLCLPTEKLRVLSFWGVMESITWHHCLNLFKNDFIKEFHFYEIQLINFSSVGHVFGVMSEKLLPNSKSQLFSMFSSRIFIALSVIFKSVFHFEPIFVNGVRHRIPVFLY